MFFLPLVPNCQLSLSHLLGVTKTDVSFTSVQTDKLFFNMTLLTIEGINHLDVKFDLMHLKYSFNCILKICFVKII